MTALGDKCSRCGDVVFYCECPYTDPAVIEDKDYMDSPSFEIFRGSEVVEWDRARRSLGGSQKLLQEILSHLDGEYVEVLIPGFCLWMSPKDPFAVHFVAENLVKGCSFSGSAPDWSEWTKPGRIY
jgi:hypothetical protein